MRKLSGILLAALLALGFAGSASASIKLFAGGLGVSIAGLPPIAATGTGVATLNGSAGGTHVTSLLLPATAFAATGVVVPVTDPGAFPIQGVQATVANATGSFASGSPPNPNPLNGTMAVVGAAKVCLFAPCSAPPPANVTVPLSVIGVGGTTTAFFLVNATVQGNPWTTGTVAIGTVVQSGFAHGPASGTSSTATSGALRLVSPTFVSTNIAASAVLPTFAILDLHLPEPGTLLLLGSGAVGLVLFGRSRRS
ncbi:MAG: PEP-CTERM sorting domain-containing protein [Myxococcota bacterium]|nr:PEP-CTERM sorting domain-containing protein [Myxococcota bacterium]